MSKPTDLIARQLREPFAIDEVSFKPQAVSGNRALAIAYIDARCVMERLDEVMGIDGWKDEYAALSDGNVQCILSLRIGDEWIPKQDVGGPSEQPDSGDKMKAAVSDAIKRTAVKWGIGRYLYDLPKQWCDYDTQKRQFVKKPALPDWACPRSQTVRDWEQYLHLGPKRDDFNDKLEQLSGMAKEDKKIVWKMINEYAANQGWVFNETNKTYGG
jgi:hypothetical protein